MAKPKALGIALTYCGAVIGAGFATGREVVVFFSAYGKQGLWGAIIAGILFIWAGVVILDVVHQNKVYSYLDFLKCVLKNKLLVTVADVLFLGTLLIGVGVMTAAGGAVLASWHIWYPGGCAGFILMCLFILRAGGNGFVKANAVLVPGMVAVIALLCILQICVPAFGLTHSHPLTASLLYVSFNIAIAAVALSTLKGQLDSSAVVGGGVGGGALIGMLLLLVYGATLGIADGQELPMAWLAKVWLNNWQWVFSLVLLAAVLTTCLANLHGLAARVGSDDRYWIALIIISALGFTVAQYGFAKLVGLLYPLLGICNIVLFAGLCYYSCGRFKAFLKDR